MSGTFWGSRGVLSTRNCGLRTNCGLRINCGLPTRGHCGLRTNCGLRTYFGLRASCEPVIYLSSRFSDAELMQYR